MPKVKKRLLIDKFIHFRVRNYTYEEISKQLKVSKPTLISWSKKFSEEIREYKQELTRKAALKLAKENQELINILAENLKRTRTLKRAVKGSREKYKQKVYRKLGDLFGVDIKSIELTLNDNGDVVNVYLVVSDE
jgi:transposase